MRRLVVGSVLRGDLYTVLRVVHQTLYTVVRVVGSRIDADAAAVSLADNEFLAPVAENISAQTRSALCRVAGVTAVCRKQICYSGLACIAGQLGYGSRRISVAVKYLALKVTVQ